MIPGFTLADLPPSPPPQQRREPFLRENVKCARPNCTRTFTTYFPHKKYCSKSCCTMAAAESYREKHGYWRRRKQFLPTTRAYLRLVAASPDGLDLDEGCVQIKVTRVCPYMLNRFGYIWIRTSSSTRRPLCFLTPKGKAALERGA